MESLKRDTKAKGSTFDPNGGPASSYPLTGQLPRLRTIPLAGKDSQRSSSC